MRLLLTLLAFTTFLSAQTLVGDGQADDTAALQKLVDAGGSVQLPKGRYRLTKTVTVDLAKLGAAGILYPFVEGQGGFGSDSDDRNELPLIARMRAGQLWNGGDAWPAEQTVVIGDTPRDIACARADGALVVAVTTGPFGADQLSDADVVLEDLRELDAALQSR